MPDLTAPAAGAFRARGGPFRDGDRVQLTDPKGRHYTVTLQAGAEYHTHRGGLRHDDLIGQPEGSLVHSPVGTPYLALRPRLADYVLSSFTCQADGRLEPIDHPGYTPHDRFFVAKGTYSLIHTCNGWTGTGLDAIGVRTGLWTPFAGDVMRQLDER